MICEDIDWLLLVFLLDAGDQLIGRRAAGAAFGGEELHHRKSFRGRGWSDGRGGGGTGGYGGGGEEGPAGEEGEGQAAEERGQFDNGEHGGLMLLEMRDV